MIIRNTKKLIPVVILDITFAGYDIIRSLHAYKIPMYALSYKKNCIEARTNRLKKIVDYDSEEDLLHKLIQLTDKLNDKPILYLTNDHRLEFVIKNYETITNLFLINLPTVDILKVLLDKSKFNDFALKHDIQTPKSITINKFEDSEQIKNFNFPIVIKPNLKTKAWHKHDMPKALKFNNLTDFLDNFPSIYRIQNELLIQEFIPGKDDDIFFCYVYFNKRGELINTFTGQKIRQWKPIIGTTSILRSIEIPEIKEMTICFFTKINYKGFGSVEYKLNRKNGKYYIIEPTAGRYDLLVHSATVAGINIPLTHYCDLSGIIIKPKETLNKNIVYINETSEMQSAVHALKTKEITLRKLLHSYKGKICFRYIYLSDFRVSGKALYIVSRFIVGQIVRYIWQTILQHKKHT